MEKVYQSILEFQRNRPKIQHLTIFVCSLFPKLTALMYVLLLGYLFITSSPQLLICIIKPCSVFLITGLFRKLWSRKRPYESLDIEPLIKHKNGQSFPSRHMASAMIISLTIYSIFPILSIPAFLITICIGFSRFFAGIHYPSDLIAGAIFSILIYCI